MVRLLYIRCKRIYHRLLNTNNAGWTFQNVGESSETEKAMLLLDTMVRITIVIFLYGFKKQLELLFCR